MSDVTRAIINHIENDDAVGMRDAFYNELQNRVMQHIENHKAVVAQNLIVNPETVEDEEDTENDVENNEPETSPQ
jgi:hypothetical protein